MNEMKTALSAVLVAIAAIVLTACSEEVEGYQYVPLTKAEKTEQINSMKGNYTGKAFFALNGYYQAFTDSVEVVWTVNAVDSTLTISNFPMKVFATGIQDEAMKAVLQSENTHSLVSKIYLYRPWGSSGSLQMCYFNIIPTGSQQLVVTMPLTIDGTEKEATLLFETEYADKFYSTGAYDKEKYMMFYLILKQLVADDRVFDAETIVAFYGTKLGEG